MEITLPAHAKINWTLDVLGRYPSDHPYDGFTKIETTFCKLALHDLITIHAKTGTRGEISIECSSPKVPQSLNGNAEENVCYHAVQALRSRIPAFPDKALEIYIEKNIPLSGGLGGSSTDGSSVLVGLNTLFELHLSQKELISIAGEIGSDTGFFASDLINAFGTERGNVVEPLPTFGSTVSVVTVYPQRELLVGRVFSGLEAKAFRGMEVVSTPSRHFSALLTKGATLNELSTVLSNDLERSAYVESDFPELSDIKCALLDAGCLGALMSGSGPSVFGVCENESCATSIVQQMQTTFPDFSVFSSQTVPN